MNEVCRARRGIRLSGILSVHCSVHGSESTAHNYNYISTCIVNNLLTFIQEFSVLALASNIQLNLKTVATGGI